MRFILLLMIVIFSCNGFAQQRYNAPLLDTLEQIAGTKTPAKYFAQLYHNAIEATNKYAATQPENVRRFVFGFESAFAPEFFKSSKRFTANAPQEFCWQQYYADPSLNELQYQFMGMNAHINGDMWLALKDKYGYDTLQKYKHQLIKFQKVLNVFFDSLYVTTKKYKKIRQLHVVTLGLDKTIGERMILHWRKRQVKLALLYYTDPEKCARKYERVKKRMLHYDKVALRWMK